MGRSGPGPHWSDRAAVEAAVDGAEIVINLAGKSVNCRYTRKNREELVRSRVETTRQLREAIRSAAKPPALWINSSTATIYRHAEDRPQTESTGDIGSGLSVDIATAWEAEFFADELAQTRRVALRMSIVLGRGGALVPLERLARVGLGGPQYDGWWFRSLFGGKSRRAAGVWHSPRRSRGRQKFSWVHIDDVVGAIRFIRERADLDGAINLTAPVPSDNRTLMALLRRRVGAPLGLPAYRWMLEPGMWLLRTEPELVLKSRWVVPERLTEAGYRFRFSRLEDAFTELTTSEGAPTGRDHGH